MYIKNDQIIFNTGKKKDAFLGIIGLSPNGEITSGFDDDLWNKNMDSEEQLTSEELIELSHYMIDQWEMFLNKIKDNEL